MNLRVRGIRAGMTASVEFLFCLPSGNEYLYKGWPDLHIMQLFSAKERRLRKPPLGAAAKEAVRAIGEIQSPPGFSCEAKNRAFAQSCYTRISRPTSH